MNKYTKKHVYALALLAVSLGLAGLYCGSQSANKQRSIKIEADSTDNISLSISNNKNIKKSTSKTINKRKNDEYVVTKLNNTRILDAKTPIINNSYDYSPYVKIEGTKFLNPGNTKAVNFNFFLPIWKTNLNNLIFSQTRVYNRTDSPFEGNVNLGYRHLLPESKIMYGIYTSLDRQHTKFGNDFNQLTFGAEAWFNHLFIGGNFYQPI